MNKQGLPSSPTYKSIKVGLISDSQPKTDWVAIQPKLRIVSDPSQLPITTRLSDSIPVRDFGQPPHGYKEFRKVDSKSQAKGTPVENGVPKYIGTSFTHTVNAPTRQPIPLPTNVSIPRPYPVMPANAQSSSGQYLNNRTMTGRMTGSPSKNYVSERNVPYLPPDQPVGPDNPVKALNDKWSACWDKEAGAIYYYNSESGEATWIPPTL